MDFYLKISGMQYFGVFSDHLDATASLSTNVAYIGDDHCLWLLMSKILCEFSP